MNVKSTIQWATPYSLGLLLALAVAALAGYAMLRWASGRPIAPRAAPGCWSSGWRSWRSSA